MKVDFILQLYAASKFSDTKWKQVKVKPLDTLTNIDGCTPFILLDKVLSLVSISNRKATAMSILAHISKTDQRSKTSAPTETYIIEPSNHPAIQLIVVSKTASAQNENNELFCKPPEKPQDNIGSFDIDNA